jgi:hypothetical protein
MVSRHRKVTVGRVERAKRRKRPTKPPFAWKSLFTMLRWAAMAAPAAASGNEALASYVGGVVLVVIVFTCGQALLRR